MEQTKEFKYSLFGRTAVVTCTRTEVEPLRRFCYKCPDWQYSVVRFLVTVESIRAPGGADISWFDKFHRMVRGFAIADLSHNVELCPKCRETWKDPFADDTDDTIADND